MKILYFDCFSGISGDMTLGALLDITQDIAAFQKELKKIGLPGEWEFKAERHKKSGIMGTDADVLATYTHDHPANGHGHRSFQNIVNIIEQSSLNANVKKTALAIFKNLAEAESEIHGIPLEEVHFHEVGAVDAIIDITGTAILIDQLSPDAIYCSPVNTGAGTVQCAHGVLPVPAPATAALLAGFEVYTQGQGERTTPTGAAILKTLCQKSMSLPLMRMQKTGYGFGKKDFGSVNALRVFLGDTDGHREKIVALETNIDDMTGEALGAAMHVLMQAGALDAFFTPVFMKKQRPAYMLTVLCRPEDKCTFEELVFKHTSTIGIRSTLYERSALDRSEKAFEATLGTVRIKEAHGFGVKKSKLEYEDVLLISQEKGMPFEKVIKALQKELDR